jgi:hypothetical protein
MALFPVVLMCSGDSVGTDSGLLSIVTKPPRQLETKLRTKFAGKAFRLSCSGLSWMS